MVGKHGSRIVRLAWESGIRATTSHLDTRSREEEQKMGPSKPILVTSLLQQGFPPNDSTSFSNSTISWGPRVQTQEPMKDISQPNHRRKFLTLSFSRTNKTPLYPRPWASSPDSHPKGFYGSSFLVFIFVFFLWH